MLEPTFDMKQAFFDRKVIMDAMDAATRKAMTKSLAKYRKRLISTFRRGKKPSKPGESPKVHSKSRYANLRNVLFAYDARNQSGVAGSIRLAKSKNAVPGILEGGGTIRYPARKRKDGSMGEARTIKIAARPAVSLAFRKSIASGEIVTPFANSIVGK